MNSKSIIFIEIIKKIGSHMDILEFLENEQLILTIKIELSNNYFYFNQWTNKKQFPNMSLTRSYYNNRKIKIISTK